MTSALDELQAQLGLGIWTLLTICPIMYFYMIAPSTVLGGAYLAPQMNYTCRLPTLQDLPLDSCNYLANGTESQPCTEWDFDHSVFANTLTSEFSLVCNRETNRATYQSLLMVGAAVGASFNGFLADRFGRKPCVLIGYILYSIANIVPFWAPSFHFVMVCRFLSGVLYPTILMTGYVLAMEVVVPKQRTIWGLVLFLPWCVGTMLWGAMGYLIRDWRYLQLATTLPYLLALPALWLMSESPRWLIVNNHTSRAKIVLKRAVRWNKLNLNDFQMDKYIQEAQEELEMARDLNPRIETQKGFIAYIKKSSTGLAKSIIVLTRTPKIRMITTAAFLSMFVTSMVYFGLSLNAVNFGMDAFAYMALTGLMEVPGYTVTIPIAARLGRKLPIIICFLTSGASLLTLPFIPEEITWIKIILAMLGKLAISAAFNLLYLYITELYPTDIRMRGASLAMLMSRLGSVCSPYITDVLGPIFPWVPSVIFGTCSVLAGLVMLPLSETLGKPMHDTVIQLETSHNNRSIDDNKGNNDPAEIKILDVET